MQKTVTFQVYDQNNIPETIWGNKELDLFFLIRDGKIELTYRRNESAFVSLGSSKENNTVELPVVDLPNENGLYKINHKDLLVKHYDKQFILTFAKIETGMDFNFTPIIQCLVEVADVTAVHIETLEVGDVLYKSIFVFGVDDTQELISLVESKWLDYVEDALKKAIHENSNNILSIARYGLGFDEMNELWDEFVKRYPFVKRRYK